MDQVLSDMKVLDPTHYIAGPYCTKLLADYGADVIKVEPPGGDPARRLGPFPDDIPHPEKSGLFLHLNTNKRSVTLNLKSATGRKIFKELVETADVVVENFRPGVMASWGLDYPALEKINPRLVMASISNFGQSGPYRDFKASELVLSGMGGEMCESSFPGREPLKYAGTVYQYQAGLLALSGILAAFYVSHWQGIGQYLDLSIMEMLVSNLDWRSSGLLRYQLNGRTAWGMPISASIMPCKDGYMNVNLGGGPGWPNVARMLGRPDLRTDPRFATPEGRIEHAEEINEILLSWLMERSRQQCWEEARAAGVMSSPLNTVEELFHDPHLRGRGFWAEVEHPALGKTTIPGRPFIFSEAPWKIKRPAPLLGEHNGEVLGELGYSQEDLVGLRRAGVI